MVHKAAEEPVDNGAWIEYGCTRGSCEKYDNANAWVGMGSSILDNVIMRHTAQSCVMLGAGFPPEGSIGHSVPVEFKRRFIYL